MTDSIERLYAAIIAARNSNPAKSRTVRLLNAGRPKMAKKVGEEAIEVVIDAICGRKDAVISESADLLYNLVVLWVALDIEPKDVWEEMQRRENLFGIAEKQLKSNSAAKLQEQAISPPSI